MFKLVVSNTVQVPVKGKLSDEAGVPRDFSFTLKCDRLTTDGVRHHSEAKTNPLDFVRKVARGWDGVMDEGGEPIAFTPEALEQMLGIQGMAAVAVDAYFDATVAKAKN